MIKYYLKMRKLQTAFFFSGAEDVFDDEMRLQKINLMMQYLPLTQSRSRRPLSVDDCVVAEEYLTKSSHSWDSGVFSPLSLSSSSLSSSDQTWMSPPPSSRLTSSPKPKAKKQLFSFPAGMCGEF